MEQQKPFSVGEKVKGVYFGQPYTGVVTHARPHTMNMSYKHHIELDSPVTVFGAQRDSIIVSIWEPKGDCGNTIHAA